MKMYILSGGRLRMHKSIYLPDADRSETIELPVSSILLRDARGNVLFETGCHPSVVQDAEARWGGLAKLMTPIMGPDDNVIAGLAALGLAPGDIDVVVCSHLHTDHCGCNAFFTKATVILHARELEAARSADALARGYVAADWDHPVSIEPVTSERDLWGDGHIVLIPLPGHTPGYNNFVDVRDVARGMVAAWERGRRGERYILGGVDMTYRDMMRLVAQQAGVAPPRMYMPRFAARVVGWMGDRKERKGGKPLANSTQVRYAYTDRFKFTSAKAERVSTRRQIWQAEGYE